MGGDQNTVNKQPRIASLNIQSSAYGLPKPWGAGRARLPFNLGFFGGFKSVEVDKKQSSGKGGSGQQTNVSWKYYADVLLFISGTASGPIRGLASIYRDKDVYVGESTGGEDVSGGCVEQAGFTSLRRGISGQLPIDYIVQTYPDQALGYDVNSYVFGIQYQLNDVAGLQNHSGEVDFFNQVGGGIVDANPGDSAGQEGFVSEFLRALVPGWAPASTGDLSDLGLYCLAAELLFSPCLDSPVTASSFIDEVMKAANSICWMRGDGTFQVRPLGDASVTANGVTWNPNLTPVYDLGPSDFIPDSKGDDPVKVDQLTTDELFTIVQLTYKNRQHQYNDETITRPNLAAVSQYGQITRAPDTIYSIKDPAVASRVLQLLLQMASTLARPFVFSLPPIFGRLEEGDLVTLTNGSLNRVPVRISQIDRDADTRKRTYRAREMLIGIANAPLYGTQTAQGGVIDFNADPGSVNPPIMFVAPTTITNGALEVWAAVGSTNPNYGGCDVMVALGTDGEFKKVGSISGGARYGVSTNDFPLHSDPDAGDSLTVDLSTSAGQLLNATQADADAFVTLSWIGGELIAYSTAQLAGSSLYTLKDYIRRGAYSSLIVDHPAGTPFARLDSSIFKYEFLSGQIGQTARVKFLAKNTVGKNVQALEDAAEYTIVLAQPGVLPGGIASVTLQSPWAGLQFTVVASAAQNATSYTWRVYLLDGTLIRTSAATPSLSFTYTQDMANADGHLVRDYLVECTPGNASGFGPPSPRQQVTNAAPAAVTGVNHSGSGGSETITWTANSESDRAGYYGYYSDTSGFDPTHGGGTLFYQGTANTAPLTGLVVGHTYYVRIAAYDNWSNDVTGLNFSAEHSFTA